MNHPPCPPAFTAIVCAIVLVATAPGARLNAETFQQTAQAQPGDTAQRALVQQVQRLLIRQGFDPGPADGLIGERTTRSVQAFQRREGLTVDGQVSETLHAALRQADARPDTSATRPQAPRILVEAAPVAEDAAGAPAAANATGSRRAEAPASIVGSTWRLIDSSNAESTLKLLRGGTVGGVGTPAYWSWQYQNGEILISYDNKMGGWVKRRGGVVGADEIRGDATSSRGRIWAWRATRIDGTR